MDPNQVVSATEQKFVAAVSRFGEELKKLRTGRAHPGMLDGTTVEAYGTSMPLIQVATITAPEAQLLQISPFDPSNLQAIAQAIRDNQSLGLNPVDDGRVVRIQMPPLTSERRQQVVKSLHEKAEECMIAMRQVRHDAFKNIDQAKKDKNIGEDEAKRLEKLIDDNMNKRKAEVEAQAKSKEQELMNV